MTGIYHRRKTLIEELECAYGKDYHFEMTAHFIPIRTEGHPWGGGRIVFLKLKFDLAYIIIKSFNKECGKLYDL